MTYVIGEKTTYLRTLRLELIGVTPVAMEIIDPGTSEMERIDLPRVANEIIDF